MKSKLLLVIITISCITFGIYASFRMLINNRTPFTLICEGLRLEPQKKYILSNSDKVFGSDTIQIRYEKPKMVMPKYLGILSFENTGWAFTNSDMIGLPEDSLSPHKPFCRELKNDGVFYKGKYYGANQNISEAELIEGIKFNYIAGDKESRVSIRLVKDEKGYFLKTNDDGLGSEYHVLSDTVNSFGVCLNKPISPKFYNNFSFDNLAGSKSAENVIKVSADIFNAKLNISGSEKSISGKNIGFDIENIHFNLKPRFTTSILILYVITLFLVVCFQLLLLLQLKNAQSPLIQVLISIRLTFNSLFFLSVPLFIVSVANSESRLYYLLCIILLNLSIFLPKNILYRFSNLKFSQSAAVRAGVISIVSLIVFYFFTSNESVFGVIPTLHAMKWSLLCFIFAAYFYFGELKNSSLWRAGFVLGYAFIVSKLSSDFGSFIYTVLALLIIELIGKDKQITPKRILLGIGTAIIYIVSIYFFPEVMNPDRKDYRLVAPYTLPSDENLKFANQGDREFYTLIDLNLKNYFDGVTPVFENIIIPPQARTTSFSDYAFHWSMTIGGYIFFILFTIVVIVQVYNLMFLLYCSIRQFKIKTNFFYTFPKSIEAQLVRFMIAYYVVAIIYPVLSNLCLMPLTGQSLPMLSISNFEVVALLIFMIFVESIFTNPAYYESVKSNYQYNHIALRKDLFATILIGIVFIGVFLGLKVIQINQFPERISWKKEEISEDLGVEIPTERGGILRVIKEKIGFSNLTEANKQKKAVLRDAISKYYTGKPYSSHVFSTKNYKMSSSEIIGIMDIDSAYSIKKKRINGGKKPFGDVYTFEQKVNNKTKHNVSNEFYTCIPYDNKTLNADLVAELNQGLSNQISKIGITTNIGAIMITNKNGEIVANSTFPYNRASYNASNVDYLIGSLKKILLAYAALTIDPKYKFKVYGGKTFDQFIESSDDYYAAALLKQILLENKEAFEKILKEEFNLALASTTQEAFMDYMPELMYFTKPLDRDNPIYRFAIGQEKPFSFMSAMRWFTSINSGLIVKPSYDKQTSSKTQLSIEQEDLALLKTAMSKVISSGTANMVGKELTRNGINIEKFYGKTGTAENSDGSANSSSSFIISNETFTVGIMLNGRIPHNESGLSAKNLFIDILPILMKYQVFESSL